MKGISLLFFLCLLAQNRAQPLERLEVANITWDPPAFQPVWTATTSTTISSDYNVTMSMDDVSTASLNEQQNEHESTNILSRLNECLDSNVVLTKERDNKTIWYQTYKKSVGECNDELKGKKADMAKLNEKFAALEAVKKLQETTIQRLEAGQSTSTTQNAEFQVTIGVQKVEIDYLKADKSKSETENLRLQAEITTLQAQITTHKVEVDDLKAGKSTSETENARLQAEITTLQAQITTHKVEIDVLKAGKSTSETENARLQAEITTLQAQITTQNVEIDVLKAGKSTSETENARLQAEINTQNSKFQEFQRQCTQEMICEMNEKAFLQFIQKLSDGLQAYFMKWQGLSSTFFEELVKSPIRIAMIFVVANILICILFRYFLDYLEESLNPTRIEDNVQQCHPHVADVEHPDKVTKKQLTLEFHRAKMTHFFQAWRSIHKVVSFKLPDYHEQMANVCSNTLERFANMYAYFEKIAHDLHDSDTDVQLNALTLMTRSPFKFNNLKEIQDIIRTFNIDVLSKWKEEYLVCMNLWTGAETIVTYLCKCKCAISIQNWWKKVKIHSHLLKSYLVPKLLKHLGFTTADVDEQNMQTDSSEVILWLKDCLNNRERVKNELSLDTKLLSKDYDKICLPKNVKAWVKTTMDKHRNAIDVKRNEWLSNRMKKIFRIKVRKQILVIFAYFFFILAVGLCELMVVLLLTQYLDI